MASCRELAPRNAGPAPASFRPERPKLERPDLSGRVAGRDLDRLVQVGAPEHVEAGDLLLGLGERAAAGREDWGEAWVRIDSAEAAVLDMLALGAEVEIVDPPELRARIAQIAIQIAALHGSRRSRLS
jgi:hypothetical protein